MDGNFTAGSKAHSGNLKLTWFEERQSRESYGRAFVVWYILQIFAATVSILFFKPGSYFAFSQDMDQRI